RAIHAQSAREEHVAFDARRGADQAVDAVLRLALLAKHGSTPSLLSSAQRHVLDHARLVRTRLVDTQLHAAHPSLRIDPKDAVESLEVLEGQAKRGGIRFP